MIVLAKVMSRIDTDSDREFFTLLYCDHEEIMYKTARKYSPDYMLCDDIVQDALIGLIPQVQKLREFDCCTLQAYIVTTVRNTALNYWRKLQVEKKYMYFDMYPEDEWFERQNSRQLEDDIVADEKAKKLGELIRMLPERDQDILIRKYYLYQTDAEIAMYHDCKPNSVRMMLTRARRSIQKHLIKEGL